MVSVIIPVKNEEKYIDGAIKPLLEQTYPSDRLEIIVIDGMSHDKTRDIIKRYASLPGQGLKIRLLENPKGRRVCALNIGIKEAAGDIVLRIDARTRVAPYYIEKCVAVLEKTGADNAGGWQKPIVEESLDPNRAIDQYVIGRAMSHPFGIGDSQFRLGRRSGFVDTVYLGCFKKSIFDKVGLFDEDSIVISEDADMNYRIRRSGGKVYFDKEIVACYYPRDNFRDIFKLYFGYGGSKAGSLLKRGALTALRQLVPPAFLLANILLPILSCFNCIFLYLWTIIVASYAILDLAVSFRLGFKEDYALRGFKKISVMLRFMAVFPVLHFSWALGFWGRLLQRPRAGQYWEY